MIAPLVLLVLALLGAPLFAVIAASALLGFQGEGIDLSVVAIEIYRLAEIPAMVAIPLFTFAGYVLGETRAPDRLVRLTSALLGWLRGGLAIVSRAAARRVSRALQPGAGHYVGKPGAALCTGVAPHPLRGRCPADAAR
jgi:TRAP-type mannitol/chloroaromatic compound transport system permease large subunit